MKLVTTISVLLIVLLSACSSRNEPTNAYDEYRQSRDGQLEISAIYQEKEDLYTSNLRELTFTGKPEVFSNVVLTVDSELTTMGMPRYYKFIESEEGLQLEVHIVEEVEDYPGTYDDIYETLTVDSIDFNEGTYTVNAEEYTFKLHMLQESIKRLRDDSGEILLTSHFIPEELQEQWLREDEDEVRN